MIDADSVVVMIGAAARAKEGNIGGGGGGSGSGRSFPRCCCFVLNGVVVAHDVSYHTVRKKQSGSYGEGRRKIIL